MNSRFYQSLYKSVFCLGIFLFTTNFMLAQESKKLGKNFFGASFGYSHVKDATSSGGTEAEGLLVPSIGLNYFRRASEYAKFGIMTDIELDNYLIFEENLERENVLIVVAVGSFAFQEHFTLLGGFGREFDQHKNLSIVRIGAEFPFELKKGWEVIPEFLYDFKEGYDVYTFGVSFGLNF
jgi:hypothetical protein